MKSEMGRLFGVGILTLGLGACANTSIQDVKNKIASVQSATKLICAFVPTIGTVAGIISKGRTDPAASIAQDICNAVTTAPLADGGARIPKVNGVTIKGSWVK